MPIFAVVFGENKDGKEDWITVTCDKLKADLDNDCVFHADKVKIEIDETIIRILEIDEDGRVL